jgi:hypothetical protein
MFCLMPWRTRKSPTLKKPDFIVASDPPVPRFDFS